MASSERGLDRVTHFIAAFRSLPTQLKWSVQRIALGELFALFLFGVATDRPAKVASGVVVVAGATLLGLHAVALSPGREVPTNIRAEIQKMPATAEERLYVGVIGFERRPPDNTHRVDFEMLDGSYVESADVIFGRWVKPKRIWRRPGYDPSDIVAVRPHPASAK